MNKGGASQPPKRALIAVTATPSVKLVSYALRPTRSKATGSGTESHASSARYLRRKRDFRSYYRKKTSRGNSITIPFEPGNVDLRGDAGFN